jgi:hypothetical protein
MKLRVISHRHESALFAIDIMQAECETKVKVILSGYKLTIESMVLQIHLTCIELR